MNPPRVAQTMLKFTIDSVGILGLRHKQYFSPPYRCQPPGPLGCFRTVCRQLTRLGRDVLEVLVIESSICWEDEGSRDKTERTTLLIRSANSIGPSFWIVQLYKRSQGLNYFQSDWWGRVKKSRYQWSHDLIIPAKRQAPAPIASTFWKGKEQITETGKTSLSNRVCL